MLDPERALALAIALMTSFAERTGIETGKGPRYLWTDAFAVCNFLALARATGDDRHRQTALHLIDRVHHTLGRHRPDDTRHGWISGLDDAAAEQHPTIGGLRIGKPLPERRASEPFDDRLEWDRDGQYFHYLTRWMVALDAAARATGDPRYRRWARELAETAHRAFTTQRRMVWKMSIDLSRPLVSSMGQHDPLDGYLTLAELGIAAPDLTAMFSAHDLATSDPLGLGGLLLDLSRAQRLDPALVGPLLAAARAGLDELARSEELRAPARARLAFRELGLAIGLAALATLDERPLDAAARRDLAALRRHLPLRDTIIDFWIDPQHQRQPTWIEHRDINEVMLATSLIPDAVRCSSEQ
jgi:hypothetical protein